MSTTNQSADALRIANRYPPGEHPVAVQARVLINLNGDAIWSADDPATLNFTTVNSCSLVSPVITTGLTASGSAANDFSGSTGDFKTSSGANTLSGTTTLAANKNLLCASGTSLFDFSLGTGTFKTSTGQNTFGGKVAFKVISTAVAAAGSSVSDAAALGSANLLHMTSDSAAKGVKLVTGVAGDKVDLVNDSATAAILYPATGGTINGLAANAGVLVPASKGLFLECRAADTWIAEDRPAKATAA